MKTIIEYVQEYDCGNFETCVLTPVDMLILAELSYFELRKYGTIYCSKKFEKFNLLDRDGIVEKITNHTIDKEYNIALAKEIFKSNRFKNLEMAFYMDKKSSRDVMQYASMVYRLANNYVIAFRGTDMSLLGWQEDLNLSFLDRLPSHELSIEFVQRVIDDLPKGANIYLVGHSKGGNFATFAASYIPPEYQSRIKGVYDFDGPGYKTDIFKCRQFKNIEHKYNKIVPYDSIVGTLMIDYSKYKVVSAAGPNGISQHSPFKWKLGDDNDFVYLPKISKTSRAFDRAFEDWLSVLDDNTKMDYTCAIFDFLYKCGIKDLRQLTGEILPLFKRARAVQKRMKKKDKKVAYQAIVKLGKLFLQYRFKRDI